MNTVVTATDSLAQLAETAARSTGLTRSGTDSISVLTEIAAAVTNAPRSATDALAQLGEMIPGLAEWTVDDSKKLKVLFDLSGSLTVGVAVVPPPPIYGS